MPVGCLHPSSPSLTQNHSEISLRSLLERFTSRYRLKDTTLISGLNWHAGSVSGYQPGSAASLAGNQPLASCP